MMKNSVAKILTIILVAILIASISTFVLADMPDPGSSSSSNNVNSISN